MCRQITAIPCIVRSGDSQKRQPRSSYVPETVRNGNPTSYVPEAGNHAEFQLLFPTRILFGQGQVQALGEQIRQHGSRILLVYGKSSIKRTGIYDAVVEQLKMHNLHFVELPGVDPNPRLTSVVEGAALCRTHELDLVLAVGGGSVIDCAKGIAVARSMTGTLGFWAAQPVRSVRCRSGLC